MIESLGPRQAVPSGPAASIPAPQADEKIVHRPDDRVMRVEPVDRTAQTGPRPAFQQTYLDRVAAYWPDEPDPPVTDLGSGRREGAAADRPPVADGDRGDLAQEPRPRLDIRR